MLLYKFMSRSLIYLLTLLLFVLSGTGWTLARYGINELRIVMMVLVMLICTVINLLQFLRLPYRINLLLPGLITSIVFSFVVQGSNVEREFFSSIGIINGIVCGVVFLLQLLLEQKRTT